MGLARHAYWYNSSTNIVKEDNHILVQFKDCSIKLNRCLALLLGPRAYGETDHRLKRRTNYC